MLVQHGQVWWNDLDAKGWCGRAEGFHILMLWVFRSWIAFSSIFSPSAPMYFIHFPLFPSQQ